MLTRARGQRPSAAQLAPPIAAQRATRTRSKWATPIVSNEFTGCNRRTICKTTFAVRWLRIARDMGANVTLTASSE